MYLCSCFLHFIFWLHVLCCIISFFHLHAPRPLDFIPFSFDLVVPLATMLFMLALFPSNCFCAFPAGSVIFQHYLIFHLGPSYYSFQGKIIIWKNKKKKRKCSSGLPLPPAVQRVDPNGSRCTSIYKILLHCLKICIANVFLIVQVCTF